MAAINIRNLSSETHRALRVRAASNGNSMEAEARRILDDAVRPPDRPRLGDMLLELFQPTGGIELNIERDRISHTPIQFDE